MYYTYTDNQCLKDTAIKKQYDQAKSKIQATINKDFANITPNTKYYKILHDIDIQKSISPLETLAKSIRNNFKDIIIIAMGGQPLTHNLY